jgi:hypothetical protein
MRTVYSAIFAKILTIFTNLRCLKFNLSSSYRDAVLFYLTLETAISSTLLELHVSVVEMRDCLHLLDGRFDQLRILNVTVNRVLSWLCDIEYEVDFFINILFV